MMQRLLSFSRTFSSSAIRPKHTTLMAVIGNNPQVPEYIKKHGLDKHMTPVYFKNEEEMMRPEKYDSALIVNSNPQQMEKFLATQKHIKWVHSTMAGVDWVLGEKLKTSDIVLTNAKGAFSHSLAEYVLLGILYHNKRTPYFNEKRAKHEWAPCEIPFAGKTNVGIIGYGNIGYHTAKLLRNSINPTIYACCRSIDDLSDKQVEVCDLIAEERDYEAVLHVSDYVVGILPKTPATANYFDMKKFKMMRKSAVFINIGRGVTMVEVRVTNKPGDRKIW